MDHRITRAMADLTQRNGRAPTPAEIARVIQADVDEVAEVLQARESLRLVSLDEEREGDDGAPIAQRDRITTKHAAGSMPVEDRVLIADAIERLSGVQHKVIYYLFYLDLTQAEAAHKLGISQKHVSRVMHAARRRRETLHPEGVCASGKEAQDVKAEQNVVAPELPIAPIRTVALLTGVDAR